jgi:hypothetical protein
MLQPELESSLEQRLASPEDLFEGLPELAAADTRGNTSSMWQQLQQQQPPVLPAAAGQLGRQLSSAGANAGRSRSEGGQHKAVALQARAAADVLLRELETNMAAVARTKMAAAAAAAARV